MIRSWKQIQGSPCLPFPFKVYPHDGSGVPGNLKEHQAESLEDSNHLTPTALPEFWEEGLIKGPLVPTRTSLKAEGSWGHILG